MEVGKGPSLGLRQCRRWPSQPASGVEEQTSNEGSTASEALSLPTHSCWGSVQWA